MSRLLLQPEQKVQSFHLYAQSLTACNSHLVPATDFDMLLQYECENVLNDAALMEACGVGLSRTDMYGVMMVCKQLGEDPKLGVATVRFFGKVHVMTRALVTGTCHDLVGSGLHTCSFIC